MLGSEWLLEFFSEEMKSQYFNFYLLFFYMLLVEEVNLIEVKKFLNSLNKELLNVLLLFYVKSKF